MTLTSLYHKGHRLTELWRAVLDNHYNIDANGHIHFQGQQLTRHTDPYNDTIVDQYMSRDRHLP